MKANMERVLRAMDVIPPFDSDSTAHRPHPRAVPTLDLGEKILAEQRRMTARKRKSPSRAEVGQDDIRGNEGIAARHGGVSPEEGADTVVVGSERGSSEQDELHQIVADIVARDIERLRAGLKRASRYPA